MDEFVHAQNGEEADVFARYLYLLLIFLMAIAALNVAGLLLARGGAREPDMALRLAIGGSRARVMSQAILEAFLISVGGAVVGLTLAWPALRWFTAVLVEHDLRYSAHIDLNVALGLFVVLLALVATSIAGLVPAVQTSRLDLSQTLKPGASNRKQMTAGRMLPVLVAGEIALSCAFLLLSHRCTTHCPS